MSRPPLRIATFNAGLAVGVLPYATERLPHVARAVAELEADVVCLQEVWLESHWDAVRNAASARFPHVYRAAPAHPAEHAACSREELAPLVACAKQHCAGLSSDELGQCVVRRCAHAAANLSTSCLNCIVSHPVGTIDEILAPCTAEDDDAARQRNVAEPHVKGSSYGYGPPGLVAYGGSYGTGILSAHPLADADVLVFEATLNARSALYARLEGTPLGDVHLFATHLSPGIREEQSVQIAAILAWMAEKVPDGARIVLAGDLNTGPSASDVHGHLDDLYGRLARAGFRNPYLDDPNNARCTFCHGSLSTGRHGRSGWLLDHVLLRGTFGEARARRVLDEPLGIEVGGRRITTTYSDHCGVLATITA